MPFNYDKGTMGGGVGGAAGGLLGSLLAEALAAGDYAKAEQLYKQAMEEFRGTNVEVGPSGLGAAREAVDPRTRAAQLAALEQMQGLANDGGMNPQMRAQLEGARQDSAQFEQGQRGALMANFRARGMGGSNLEAQSLLTAQQGAANRDALGGIQAASDAQKRSFDAILQSGRLGGEIHKQDYGEHADEAGANDAISQFNARNRIQKAALLADMAHGQGSFAEREAERKKRTIAGAGEALGTVAGSLYGFG